MLHKSRRYSFSKGIPENVFSTPMFTLRYRKNDSNLSLGVVVGKKVSPKANVRHRMKRIIRHIFQDIFAETDSSFDVVVYVRREALKTGRDELAKTINNTLYKIGILQ